MLRCEPGLEIHKHSNWFSMQVEYGYTLKRYQDVWSTWKMVNSKQVDNQLVNAMFTNWPTANIFGL